MGPGLDIEASGIINSRMGLLILCPGVLLHQVNKAVKTSLGRKGIHKLGYCAPAERSELKQRNLLMVWVWFEYLLILFFFFFSYPSSHCGKEQLLGDLHMRRGFRGQGQEVLDLLSLAGTAGPGNIPKSLTFISHPSARAGLCPRLPSPLDVSFSLFAYFLFLFLSPTLQSQHCSSL